MGKLSISKKERIAAFGQMEGFYKRKTTHEYAVPANSKKTSESTIIFKLKHIDPAGHYALYKGLQILSQATIDNAISAGATSGLVSILGVVASYDQNNAQYILELVDMDDKTIYRCSGKDNTFRGTATEFGLNTAAINDEALRGGLVAGFTLKKLNNVPAGFINNLKFDDAYKTQYDSVYP